MSTSTETAAETTKAAWHFRCVNGQGGKFVSPGDPMTAKQALDYCRLQLGPKVVRVT